MPHDTAEEWIKAGILKDHEDGFHDEYPLASCPECQEAVEWAKDMTDQEVRTLDQWVEGTAARVENPDIYLQQHIQDVRRLIKTLTKVKAKLATCEGMREELRSEIEACKITLESLWHFAMCNFDHCQRCINDESIIKDLRDRFSLKSESDD